MDHAGVPRPVGAGARAQLSSAAQRRAGGHDGRPSEEPDGVAVPAGRGGEGGALHVARHRRAAERAGGGGGAGVGGERPAVPRDAGPSLAQQLRRVGRDVGEQGRGDQGHPGAADGGALGRRLHCGHELPQQPDLAADERGRGDGARRVLVRAPEDAAVSDAAAGVGARRERVHRRHGAADRRGHPAERDRAGQAGLSGRCQACPLTSGRAPCGVAVSTERAGRCLRGQEGQGLRPHPGHVSQAGLEAAGGQLCVQDAADESRKDVRAGQVFVHCLHRLRRGRRLLRQPGDAGLHRGVGAGQRPVRLAGDPLVCERAQEAGANHELPLAGGVQPGLRLHVPHQRRHGVPDAVDQRVCEYAAQLHTAAAGRGGPHLQRGKQRHSNPRLCASEPPGHFPHALSGGAHRLVAGRLDHIRVRRGEHAQAPRRGGPAPRARYPLRGEVGVGEDPEVSGGARQAENIAVVEPQGDCVLALRQQPAVHGRGGGECEAAC